MTHIINNRETSEGDKVNYIDLAGRMHEATLTSIAEQDGNHFTEVEFEKDGQKTKVTWVPHNTSPEKHSWNHPIVTEGSTEHIDDEEVSNITSIDDANLAI
jgi:hypothetical protein